MKKKLVVLVLLLSLVCGLVLSGCSLVKKNNERIAASVVSTVHYDYKGNDNFPNQTLTLDITRTEFLNYVNYIIYLYSQYQMDYDINDIFEDGLESLRTQKYQMLKAMEYLMNNSSAERREAMYYFTDEYKAIYGKKITVEGLLTVAERYKAISDTNKDFYSNIDTYIEEYNTENRELEISKAKESLAGFYNNGYTVKEDGISIAKLVDENAESDSKKYADGLYQTQFNSDYKDVEYTKVYVKIILEKNGSDDATVYYPALESMIALADAEDKNNNPRLTNRLLTVTYQEPSTEEKTTTDDKGKETKTTVKTTIDHKVDVNYVKFTPRNVIAKDSDGNETVETIDYLDGEDYNYRYKTSFTTDTEKEFAKSGAIFEISPKNLAGAEKEAYRQFRQAKKAQYIGFDENESVYNGLGYFYQTSFQSAILTAVQHEVALTAYAEKPISDTEIEEHLTTLAKKQKEEYDLLSKEKQVAKFAKTIGTNLETCYYIPLDALKETTYKYKDAEGVEHEKAYAVANEDGTYTIDVFYIAHILFKFDDSFKTVMDRATANITDTDAVKQAKLDLIFAGLLKTNTSNADYPGIKGEELKDAYKIITDAQGNPVLDKNEQQQLAKTKVVEVYNQLLSDLDKAEDEAAKLDVFKSYMTKYNDDSGSLSNNLGYFIGMGDIEHSYDGDDFPNAAKKLYADFLADGKLDEYTALSFTSYGLHVETISFMPFKNVTIKNLGNGLYTFAADKNLDLSGEKNFKNTLRQSLVSTQKTEAYSAWTGSISKEEVESHSTTNKKILKTIKKDLNI